MKFLNKIKTSAILLFHYLFYAMRAGDNMISQQSGEGHDSTIDQHLTTGGVMEDLLNQEETQQVKEIRDEYYRILNEADKYRVDVNLKLSDDGEVLQMSASARKKKSSDFSQHCNVYDGDGLKLRLIQDNKHIEKDSDNTLSSFNTKTGVNVWDYDTTLDLSWGDIIPRFRLNKFVSKIVVKEYNNTEAIIDLYLPTIAGQFTKLDALLINEINHIFKDDMYRSDIKEIKEISFITDKAWNCDSLCEFSYDMVTYVGICVYDGNFVLSYKGHIVSDGVPVTDKYKTKELDEKYKNNAPKSENIDIFTLNRHIDGINFGEEKLKLK